MTTVIENPEITTPEGEKKPLESEGSKEGEKSGEKENLTPEQQEEKNKAEAIKQERERRKEAEAKLAEYERKEKEAEEKEKIKKGKYEEVIAEKETKLSDFKKQIEELTPYKEKFESTMNKQIEELETKIPEGKKEFIKKLIDGKSHDEKVEILSEFVKDYKGTPSPTPGNHQAGGSAFERAKQGNSIQGMIANAPIIK